MFRRTLLALMAPLAGLVGLAGIAHAQSNDPFAGLPSSAVAVGAAIKTGSPSAIVSYLRTGSVTKTAYPGDGSTVSHETAVADITSAIVSTPDATDDQGSGRYGLLAVWLPTADPSGVYLIGSGIDANGTRITTVFTVKDGAIVSYGRAADTARNLTQFAKDGDLRMVPPTERSSAPTAPIVGTGTQTGSGGVRGGLLLLAGVLLLIASAGSAITYRR